jgi:hypothetical protein
MVEKFDPNPILVNISKLKLYRTPDLASRGLRSIMGGGRKALMTVPHQNLLLKYIIT